MYQLQYFLLVQRIFHSTARPHRFVDAGLLHLSPAIVDIAKDLDQLHIPRWACVSFYLALVGVLDRY